MSAQKSSSTKLREEEDPPSSSRSQTIKNKKTQIKQIEPLPQIGSFFVVKNKKKINLKSGFTERGIRIYVEGIPLDIVYPKDIWQKYPLSLKKSLSENLTFFLSMHLPYLLNINVLDYQVPTPSTQKLLSKGFISALPSTALMKPESTSSLLKKFSKIEYYFNGKENSITESPSRKTENIAAILFSFGKDSLLTYSVCNEIGIKTIPFYVKEPLSPIEDYHKEILAKRFSKEFKKKVLFLDNKAGQLRDSVNNDGYGWELNLAQFGLIGLPIVFAKRARYLFYSNEQSCNDGFLDEEGFLGYPAYDQTVEWMLKLQRIVRILGIKNLKVGSIIEPLHDLAIIKILHHRYPEIAKYQMSCGEDMPQMKNHRWCGDCSKCARVYILFLANKINPKKLDFPTNMLKLKHKNKFVIFDGENEKHCGYDKALLGRDEQLLAFYLAYKNGYQGELINLFKNLYLQEVKKREKELREKFFSIHSTVTMPDELKDRVLKIYREELRDLK